MLSTLLARRWAHHETKSIVLELSSLSLKELYDNGKNLNSHKTMIEQAGAVRIDGNKTLSTVEANKKWVVSKMGHLDYICENTHMFDSAALYWELRSMKWHVNMQYFETLGWKSQWKFKAQGAILSGFARYKCWEKHREWRPDLWQFRGKFKSLPKTLSGIFVCDILN